MHVRFDQIEKVEQRNQSGHLSYVIEYKITSPRVCKIGWKTLRNQSTNH